MSNNLIHNMDKMETAFLGELSLDGKINPIEGALPMIISMRELNIKQCIVPYDNKEECSVISDLDIIPVKDLKEVVDFF